MPDQSYDLGTLEELTAAPGISGREQAVARLIERDLPPEFDIAVDPLGNLTAHRPGSGPKLLFLTHMDEVGLIVQRILPNGFLTVERIGGMSLSALPGTRLDLWTQSGRLPAQVGLLPAHLDRAEPVALGNCFIDIGARSDQEACAMGVQVGDFLTWAHHFQVLNDRIISSKALDDRLGCFALLCQARAIAKDSLPVDLTLAFSVQEEIMLSGSLPIIHRLQPDVVIGIDGTLAFDTPDLDGLQSAVSLGNGPVLKWMDAIRGKLAAYVPDLGLCQQIRSIAQQNGIPLQHEVTTGLTTALTMVPFQENGIRTAALSLPIRYHHTPIESADLRDLEALITLMTCFIKASCL